jgi:hypothetical protein
MKFDSHRCSTGRASMRSCSACSKITAAGASVGTTGTIANESGTENNATTAGGYVNRMAVFTIAKGSLMCTATIAGQRYSYSPRGG